MNMTNSSENDRNITTTGDGEDLISSMSSSEDILFFRLSSAVEAIVFVLAIFNVLPIIYRARNRLPLIQSMHRDKYRNNS